MDSAGARGTSAVSSWPRAWWGGVCAAGCCKLLLLACCVCTRGVLTETPCCLQHSTAGAVYRLPGAATLSSAGCCNLVRKLLGNGLSLRPLLLLLVPLFLVDFLAEIPPGRFMSQGLVRICPQGFYRQNWVNFDAANGTLCLPCRPGITTAGAGKGLPSDCNIVVDGYGVQTVSNFNGTAPAQLPAIQAESDGGYPSATLCQLGFYSKNGFCVACPHKTVTTSRGAKSIEECGECTAAKGFVLWQTQLVHCGLHCYCRQLLVTAIGCAAQCFSTVAATMRSARL